MENNKNFAQRAWPWFVAVGVVLAAAVIVLIIVIPKSNNPKPEPDPPKKETPFSPTFPSTAVKIKDAVKDADGNSYDAVKIGSQVWMVENLRTTKYDDGTVIPKGGNYYSDNTAYWYYPNNDSTKKSKYGLLYNWKAVMGFSSSSSSTPSRVQGICPKGWHVPSTNEWYQLTLYIRNNKKYCCGCNTSNIAKSLAYSDFWKYSDHPCHVGCDQASNNATGFSAIPAGSVKAENNSLKYDTANAHFWSATAVTPEAGNINDCTRPKGGNAQAIPSTRYVTLSNDNGGQYSETQIYTQARAYCRTIQYQSSEVISGNADKTSGYSVRCVQDNKEDMKKVGSPNYPGDTYKNNKGAEKRDNDMR